MNDRTKPALRIVAVAAIMGVLGDVLLRETPWGLNAVIWAAALGAAVSGLLFRGIELSAKGLWLGISTIGFAALIAWRDSPTLKALDGLCLIGVLSLAALHSKYGRVALATMSEYLQGLFIAGYNATFGPLILLLADIRWSDMSLRGRPRQLAAAARGIAIAFPLLLVFGGLFMAADAAFESIIKNALQFSPERVLVHCLVTSVCAWSVCGSLRAVFLDTGERETGELETGELAMQARLSGATIVGHSKQSETRPVSLGIVEIGVVLGLLDLLFFCFVIVQFRYFFGGASTVEETTGLTFAVYARRGFFELVTVAVLVLPMLLIAHWLLRTDNVKHEWIFRVLAGTQIVLLFVIMISALERMRLYQNEYGLTELRLYTTAFMGWLAIVFIWFAATVLRGKRQHFAFGSVGAACLLIIALHVLNPDALIVKANTARAVTGRGFDAAYAASLSADAVPSLVAALPSLNPLERRIVAMRVLSRWTPLEHADWRAQSWSRNQAWRTIQQNDTTLRTAAAWWESQAPPQSPVSGVESR